MEPLQGVRRAEVNGACGPGVIPRLCVIKERAQGNFLMAALRHIWRSKLGGNIPAIRCLPSALRIIARICPVATLTHVYFHRVVLRSGHGVVVSRKGSWPIGASHFIYVIGQRRDDWPGQAERYVLLNVQLF